MTLKTDGGHDGGGYKRLVVVGDFLIRSDQFVAECQPFVAAGYEITAFDWHASDITQLQAWNLKVEKEGSEAMPPAPQLAEAARSANAIITHFCTVPRAVIEHADRLKVIAVARGGVENINTGAASERGIAVMHIVGRHANAVAELALGLMLAEMRHIARAHPAVQRGYWYREEIDINETFELSGRTVGLVGFGAVARVLAKRLAGFEVRLLVFDPFVASDEIRAGGAEPVDLDALLRQSDVVSLHARLSPETRGLIGERELALMKPTAYLINTARAGLIDEAALVAALREHRIKGAGLDVYEHEPLPADDPLCSLGNVTLAAHQAGATRDALMNSARLVTRGAYRYLSEGWDEWVVNKRELALAKEAHHGSISLRN